MGSPGNERATWNELQPELAFDSTRSSRGANIVDASGLRWGNPCPRSQWAVVWDRPLEGPTYTGWQWSAGMQALIVRPRGRNR